MIDPEASVGDPDGFDMLVSSDRDLLFHTPILPDDNHPIRLLPRGTAYNLPGKQIPAGDAEFRRKFENIPLPVTENTAVPAVLKTPFQPLHIGKRKILHFPERLPRLLRRVQIPEPIVQQGSGTHGKIKRSERAALIIRRLLQRAGVFLLPPFLLQERLFPALLRQRIQIAPEKGIQLRLAQSRSGGCAEVHIGLRPDALKHLVKSYAGKVKCIYIDPPYNTGNDFVYEDDFAQSTDKFMAGSGQLDEDMNRLVCNTESNGRFHTDWLNMIYPRLKVAKDLLTDDGVIFISIDEVEVNNLQKLCDEIFGASNFVSQLVWAAGRKNDSKLISVSHEFILCYVKNISYLNERKITWREKKQGLSEIYATYSKLKQKYGDNTEMIQNDLKQWYKNLPDGHPAKDHKHYSRVDKNGIYFASDISWPGGGGPKYEVLHPKTGKPVTIPSRGWITSRENLQKWIIQDRVDFGPNETFVPTVKSYLKEREYSVPYSVFYKDGRAASKRLAMLMGDKVFENPKDEEIIQRLIEFCGVSEDDIVMDFFLVPEQLHIV